MYHDILHFGLNDWSWTATDTGTCFTDDKYKIVKEAFNEQMDWVTNTLSYADWNNLGHSRYSEFEHGAGEISGRLSDAMGMWESCVSAGYVQAGTYVGQVASWIFPVHPHIHTVHTHHAFAHPYPMW